MNSFVSSLDNYIYIRSHSGLYLTYMEEDGVQLFEWNANGDETQQFYFDSPQIKNVNGKCLSFVEDGEYSANLQILDCDGETDQRWTFDASLTPTAIKSLSTRPKLCLTAVDPLISGSAVKILICEGGVDGPETSQLWFMDDIPCIAPHWQYLPTTFKAIDVSAATDGRVAALDTDYNVYAVYNSNADTYSWTKLLKKGNRFVTISAGTKLVEIFVINKNAKQSGILQISASRASGRSTDVVFQQLVSNKKWQYWLPGEMSDGNFKTFDDTHVWEYISAGSRYIVWGLNADGRAHEFLDDGSMYTSNTYPSTIDHGCSPTACFSQLSVGADGVVIGIDKTNAIYSYNNNNTQWNKVCGTDEIISKISIVTKDRIWAVINKRIAIGHF